MFSVWGGFPSIIRKRGDLRGDRAQHPFSPVKERGKAGPIAVAWTQLTLVPVAEKPAPERSSGAHLPFLLGGEGGEKEKKQEKEKRLYSASQSQDLPAKRLGGGEKAIKSEKKRRGRGA